MLLLIEENATTLCWLSPWLNTFTCTTCLKTDLKIGRHPHAVFKYISIVNRKGSWPVLVFNYSFCSQL